MTPYIIVSETQDQKIMREANELRAERDALLDDLATLVEEVFEMDSEMMEE